MKLHLTQAENNNLITGYGNGFVEINKERFNHALIVMPDTLIQNWSAQDFTKLSELDFDVLVQLAPELVLLGTGNSHRFVHPRLTVALAKKGIAVECMTTHAACRTFNILMSEGRQVAAALLL